MKTRAQGWSKVAFDRVSAQKGQGTQDKYRTACMKMPGLIHQSGLLQALVFMVARDDAGRAYVDHVAEALGEKGGYAALIGKAQLAELEAYLALARDVADVAQWFRRFAQIELGGA